MSDADTARPTPANRRRGDEEEAYSIHDFDDAMPAKRSKSMASFISLQSGSSLDFAGITDFHGVHSESDEKSCQKGSSLAKVCEDNCWTDSSANCQELEDTDLDWTAEIFDLHGATPRAASQGHSQSACVSSGPDHHHETTAFTEKQVSAALNVHRMDAKDEAGQTPSTTHSINRPPGKTLVRTEGPDLGNGRRDEFYEAYGQTRTRVPSISSRASCIESPTPATGFNNDNVSKSHGGKIDNRSYHSKPPLRTQLSARDILGDEALGEDGMSAFTLQPDLVVPLARGAFGKARSLCKPLLAQEGGLVLTGTDQLLTREALATKKKDGALVFARIDLDALSRTPSGMSWTSPQSGEKTNLHAVQRIQHTQAHSPRQSRASLSSLSAASASAASMASSASMTSSSSSMSSLPLRQVRQHKVVRLGESCIRDMVWLRQGRQALVATGAGFGLAYIDPDDRDSLESARHEPCQQGGSVKASTLRQMAVSTPHLDSVTARVASGGFDRRVQVWRPDRVLFDRIEPPEAECATEGVVGSVQWHPRSPDLVSWTLDSGTFEMFDVRAGTSVRCLDDCIAPATPGSMPLFTHAFIGDTTVLLGFGNGVVKVVDVRKLQTLGGWRDETVSIIGDVSMSPQRTRAVVTGIGGASFHATGASRSRSYTACPLGAATFPVPLYSPAGLRLPAYACKTSATFLDETTCYVVDSGGQLSRYRLE